MCLFHKWGKWEEYEQHMTTVPGRLAPKEIQGKEYHVVEMWQKRQCEKCGFVQRQEVRGA